MTYSSCQNDNTVHKSLAVSWEKKGCDCWWGRNFCVQVRCAFSQIASICKVETKFIHKWDWRQNFFGLGSRCLIKINHFLDFSSWLSPTIFFKYEKSVLQTIAVDWFLLLFSRTIVHADPLPKPKPIPSAWFWTWRSPSGDFPTSAFLSIQTCIQLFLHSFCFLSLVAAFLLNTHTLITSESSSVVEFVFCPFKSLGRFFQTLFRFSTANLLF